jgi:type IV secretion system protein VirB9
MKYWLCLGCLSLAAPLHAQIVPMPDRENTRFQSVTWAADQDILLTVLPNASLTIMLRASEQIERVTMGEAAPVEIRVTGDGNSFVIIPQGADMRTTLQVQTQERLYRFLLRTQDSPLSALLVRVAGSEQEPVDTAVWEPEGTQLWTYQLRGANEVRPQAIRDDARRTFIEYAPDQPLPAVFAIGATGEEEVVNGYMRNGIYVIDRVYPELVFRIDDARARATRNRQPEAAR